jgi:membrane-associated phospholipid phosphatase
MSGRSGTDSTVGRLPYPRAVVFGVWLNVAWIIAALVAWSRVRLRVDTVGQVITGAVLGAGTTLAVFPWLP